MKISLRNFVAIGKFGPIELGIARAKVRESIGAPPNWSEPFDNPELAAIWKYGDIEFYFTNDKLWMIFTDDFEIPRGCEQFELDEWKIERDCTPPQMERHLSEAGIAYRIEDFPYADNSVRLISEAGTTLTFCGEDAARLELVSIFRSTFE